MNNTEFWKKWKQERKEYLTLCLLKQINIKLDEIPKMIEVINGILHIFIKIKCESKYNHLESDKKECYCYGCKIKELKNKPNFVKYFENENQTIFKFKKDLNDYSDPFEETIGFPNHFLDCQNKLCDSVRKPIEFMIECQEQVKRVFCYCKKCKDVIELTFLPTNNLGKWEDEPYEIKDATRIYENNLIFENEWN